MALTKKWTYFTEKEVEGLDAELVAMLDRARGLSRVPFVIMSGLRSPEKNQAVGGVENSAHLRGLAVDLHTADGSSRFKMMGALFLAGFRRMGNYPHHIHVDLDSSLPQDVMWTSV